MESAAPRPLPVERPGVASPAAARLRPAAVLRLHPDVLIAGGLFLFAAVLRLAYVAWAPVFIGGDSLQYFQPVHDLLNGRGFTLSLKRPPAYSATILLSQLLFGASFLPLIVFQHLLGATTVALTYGTGRLLFGRPAGVAAALLVAIAGPLMRWEHFLMSEALFTFAAALVVFLLVLAMRRSGRWPWAAAGLALGLALLTRSAGAALLPAVLLAPLLVEPLQRPFRPWLLAAGGRAALVLGVCALVVVPWMVRNWLVHGAFTIAGAAGQNLITYTAIIHRPDFSFEDPLVGALDTDPRKATARQIVQKAMEDKLAKPQLDVTGLGIHNRIMEETRMSQARANAVMQEIAVRAIVSRPLAYLRNTAEDVADIFRGREESLREHWDLWQSRGWRGPFSRYVGPASPAQEASFDRLALVDRLYHPARAALPLAALFALGTALAVVYPAWRPALVPAAAAAGLIVLSAATVGFVPRYRLPPDPMINVVAMGALVWLATWAVRRLRPAARGADEA